MTWRRTSATTTFSKRFRPHFDVLEARVTPTVDLRIATYNVGQGVRSGLQTVLRAIGDQVVNGASRPVDILALQEVNSSIVSSVVGLLNAEYGPGKYSYSTDFGVGDTTQGLVYRADSVQLVSANAIGTVSGSGIARQPIRYQLRPIGYGTGADIYLYNMHAKASDGDTDVARRNVEAQTVRANADALGQGANILYVGDFNYYSNTEPGYITFLSSGNGQAYDPTGTSSWAGSGNAARHTQSPTTTERYFGQIPGGLDDRFDFQLLSHELNDGLGVDLIAGSYRVLGNNGSTYNSSIDSPSNTWVWNGVSGSTVVRGTLLSALASVTDHLPVIADYDIVASPTPTIGSFTVTPTSVTQGNSITLSASQVSVSSGSIAHVRFYRENNGVTGFQFGSDQLVGSGTQSGDTWSLVASTTGIPLGTGTYYAVATSAVDMMSAASTATINIVAPPVTGTLAAWEMTGQTSFGTNGLMPTSSLTGITSPTGLTRGSGVTTTGTAASNAWGGTGWSQTTSADGVNASKFVTFSFQVGVGSEASFSSLDLYYRRSSFGPNSAFWQYQIGSGAWTTIGDFPNAFSSTSSSGAAMTTLNLAGIAGLQDLAPGTQATFRLVPYGATSSGGTWYVYNRSGNDLAVAGSLAAATTPATRWLSTVNSDGAQGSVVRSLELAFDAPIDSMTAGAFVLTIDTGTSTGVTVNVAGFGTNTLVATFADANFADDIGPVTYDSLVDGRYRLRIDGSKLTSNGQAVDADGDGSAGGIGEAAFTRLFGDINNDGFFDALDIYPHLITAIDTAIGQPGYRVAFDYNGDGFVDALDIYPSIITRIDTGV